MPKRRKRGKLAIVNNFGSYSSCYMCSTHDVEYVVHENIDLLDLSDWFTELDSDQRSATRKRFKNQCDQRFLCKSCWSNYYYMNDERYDPDTSMADFTSMYIRNWKNYIFKTVEEVVAPMLKD